MNAIGRAHALLSRHAPDFCLGVLAGGDMQARIERVLAREQATRRWRHSPLHPVLVTWLVLCLPLFRGLSVPNVFAHLMAALRPRVRGLSLRPVTDGALAHARARLGAPVLRALFEELGAEVRPEPTFHNRRVFALDATVPSTPDTPRNEATFGRHVASRGHSAFPQFRLVTLTAVDTHEIRAARWCPYGVSEITAAAELLPYLEKGDLVLLDRGLNAAWMLERLATRGVDFLCRLQSNRRLGWLLYRGTGDAEGRIMSRWGPGGRVRAKITIPARLITYRLDGRTVRLATSLADASIAARELVELYHLRWEQELAFDELKTHLSAAGCGVVHTTFRGRSGPMVEQELWATLTLYNLLRRLMARAAALHRIDPRRLSFVNAVEVVRLALPAVQAGPRDALVGLYVRLVSDLGGCALRRWRRPRRAPRALKIKTHTYRHKKQGEHTVRVDFLATLQFGAA